MATNEVTTKTVAFRRKEVNRGFDDELPPVEMGDQAVTKPGEKTGKATTRTRVRVRTDGKFPSLLADAKTDDPTSKAKQQPQPELVEIIEGSRYKAYRSKMKLFAIFIAANIVFVIIIQCAPSIVVSLIFVFYILFSAVPKFVFGSLLTRFRPHVRTAPPPPEEIEGVRRWQLTAEMFKCPSCGGNCTGSHFCSFCGQNVFEDHPILVTACVTVHHEDWQGVNKGVRSFEISELPFEAKFMQVVYIVDGRYDRSGKLDTQQLDTMQFLVTRLHNLSRDDAASDGDGVIRFKDKSKDPIILEDGTAMYKGKFGAGMDFVVLLKKTNRGKRDSHDMFFNYMDQGITAKTAKAIMFIDSDVEFAWKGNLKSLGNLYTALVKRDVLGGACGEIEVAHWYKNPLTITQYFEYKSNQFLAKTGENWFGMVTCLPGAFCMAKPQALEHVLNQYLAKSASIWEKNQLDLGEDRTLTTLLLEHGWDTGYVPRAVARTDAPVTLVGLIKQRRRWINSTTVNMANLLQKVHRPATFPLIISLGLELVTSFLLPTAILQLFIQIGRDMHINMAILLAGIVLWGLLLVTLSLTTKVEKMEYWFHASTIIGAAMMAVMLIYIVQDIGNVFNKYWVEVIVMVSWLGLVMAASIVHGQWRAVFNIVAPVVFILMSPMMYIIIPIYAICNFDDVSWGTRGS